MGNCRSDESVLGKKGASIAGGTVPAEPWSGSRMPCIFINHGGGPMPLLGQQPEVAQFLSSYASTLPQKPAAVLVVTAHWEMPVATVSAHPNPPLLFDYGGFPPESYRYKYGAPGSPDVASAVKELVKNAGLPVAEDAVRGWDHGVFVPMMLMFPNAEVPICMLSLRRDQDATAHLALGKALAPLRDHGVLIVGSGASFHNFNFFFARGREREMGCKHAATWDAWLRGVLTEGNESAEQRLARVAKWEKEPSAHEAHPRGAAEHLMPLFVLAGAGFAGGACAVVGKSASKPSTLMTGLAVSQFEWK